MTLLSVPHQAVGAPANVLGRKLGIDRVARRLKDHSSNWQVAEYKVPSDALIGTLRACSDSCQPEPAVVGIMACQISLIAWCARHLAGRQLLRVSLKVAQRALQVVLELNYTFPSLSTDIRSLPIGRRCFPTW